MSNDLIDRRLGHPDTEQMLEALQAHDNTIAEWARWPSGRVSVRVWSGEVIEI